MESGGFSLQHVHSGSFDTKLLLRSTKTTYAPKLLVIGFTYPLSSDLHERKGGPGGVIGGMMNGLEDVFKILRRGYPSPSRTWNLKGREVVTEEGTP